MKQHLCPFHVLLTNAPDNTVKVYIFKKEPGLHLLP